MACGDVLSLEDLQTAKKHQVFEAEVITGKAGGVAGGATIGTATNPVTGQTQQTLPSILADLGFDVQSWTSSTGGVLASANQVFLNDTSGSLGLGDYYAWGGPFPKTVPAGTDPALVGSGYIMRSSRFAGTQAREALRRSYAEAGYNLVDGSFEAGGTLVNANDVLLQERTGKVFSGPVGSVSAGTNPASGGFVDRSGELLRSRAVGVDAGTSASLQVMTDRGSVMFTEVSGPATTGDLIIGGVVYRLTASNVESSSSLSDEMKDGGCGWPQLRTAEETALKGRNAPLQITDDDVATNGTMKAWRLAEGIRDAATAGSFMTGYESEPDSQVIGFTGFDKIGSYQARDSVALFSQVQGQATTCEGAFTYTATTVTGSEIQTKWDKIKVGMILDTNLGNTGTYKGAVVTGKVDPYTLQVSPWVNAAGATVAPPTNGTTGRINARTHLWGLNSNAIVNNGAVQGIGAEIGMWCVTSGSGTNSKVIYAVNLGGEAPEFGFYGKGPFRKGYTMVDVSEFAFYSKGLSSSNASHFRAEDAAGAVEYDYGSNGLRYGAIDYALASASGQLSTRPLTLANGNNMVMTMPAAKQGRHLRYRNLSATVHTVNGVSVPAGALIEFISDGSSWIRLCTIP